MVGLAASQAVTGRSTYPLFSNRNRINWSVGELRLLGLVWAFNWLALAVFGLVGALYLSAHEAPPISPLGWLPIILLGSVFQLLMEQRHNRRWPFRDRVSGT
jgi:hypothetical protein